MRLPRTMMSAGPTAGVPAPSTIIAFRIARDSARFPAVGDCASDKLLVARRVSEMRQDVLSVRKKAPFEKRQTYGCFCPMVKGGNLLSQQKPEETIAQSMQMLRWKSAWG